MLMLQVIYVSNNVYIQIKKKKKPHEILPDGSQFEVENIWSCDALGQSWASTNTWYVLMWQICTQQTHTFLFWHFRIIKKLYPLCQVYGILQKELNNRKSPTWVQQLQIFQKVVSKSLKNFSLQLNSQNQRIKPW